MVDFVVAFRMSLSNQNTSLIIGVVELLPTMLKAAGALQASRMLNSSGVQTRGWVQSKSSGSPQDLKKPGRSSQLGLLDYVVCVKGYGKL